jgi:uncharacterized protein (TIGR03437 family)
MKTALPFITRYASIGIALMIGPALFAQAPIVATGGVLNAASFTKDSAGHGTAVAPGSIVAIFGASAGAYPGATDASASTIPYSTSLGGLSVAFIDSNGVSHDAPLQASTPSGAFPFVTAQVPFEILDPSKTSDTATVVVTVKGQGSSAPVSVPIAASSPGIFTIPATGQGNAVLVYVDSKDKIAKIAGPKTANIGYPTEPIGLGVSGFFYATGLGALTPSIGDGVSGIDGVTHEATLKPQVFIGTVPVAVAYWGPSGYPGVYQVNITVPSSAPLGDNIPLTITTPDGSIKSNVGTISVKSGS